MPSNMSVLLIFLLKFEEDAADLIRVLSKFLGFYLSLLISMLLFRGDKARRSKKEAESSKKMGLEGSESSE